MKTKATLTHGKSIAILFVVMLYLPLLGNLSGLGNIDIEYFRDSERRSPAFFPDVKVDLGSLAEFPKHFESYFGDHFGFRNSLIKANNYLDVFILGISPKKDLVMLGQDGWLFLGDHYQTAFSQHTGQHVVSDSVISSFVLKEFVKKTWANRRGIRYLTVIAPDKASIYPEYLPNYIRDPNRVMSTNRVMAVASKMNFYILDLRNILVAGKSKYGDFLYGKTDTHWSDLGAYIAYGEIMKSLTKIAGPLRTLEIRDHRPVDSIGGDLAGFVGLRSSFSAVRMNMEYSPPFSTLKVFDYQNNKLWDDPEKEIENHHHVICLNPNALNDKTVLLVRDSFANALSPLFNQSFTKSVYAHWYSPEARRDMFDIIFQNRPDIIISEYVERYIINGGVIYHPWNNILMNRRECEAVWPVLPDSTFKFSPGEWSRQNEGGNFQAKLSVTEKDELTIQSQGDESFFEVPLSSLLHHDNLVFLEITSPQPGTLHFYHRSTNSTKYNKNLRVSRKLLQGRNKVILEILSQNKIQGIRLTFGNAPGRYVLHDFQIKPVPNDALPALYGKSPLPGGF